MHDEVKIGALGNAAVGVEEAVRQARTAHDGHAQAGGRAHREGASAANGRLRTGDGKAVVVGGVRLQAGDVDVDRVVVIDARYTVTALDDVTQARIACNEPAETNRTPRRLRLMRVQRITRSASGSPLATPCWNKEPAACATPGGSGNVTAAANAAATEPERFKNSRRLVPVRTDVRYLKRPMAHPFRRRSAVHRTCARRLTVRKLGRRKTHPSRPGRPPRVVHRKTAQADFGNLAGSGRGLANQERPGRLAQQVLTFGVVLVKSPLQPPRRPCPARAACPGCHCECESGSSSARRTMSP